jgi:phenylalanine-4-hydroxylase
MEGATGASVIRRRQYGLENIPNFRDVGKTINDLTGKKYCAIPSFNAVQLFFLLVSRGYLFVCLFRYRFLAEGLLFRSARPGM